MVISVSTVALEGIEAKPVDVQFQVASGTVSFTAVGLPDKAVTEARERVRSALVIPGSSALPMVSSAKAQMRPMSFRAASSASLLTIMSAFLSGRACFSRKPAVASIAWTSR